MACRRGRRQAVTGASLTSAVLHPALPDPVVMKPRLHDVVTCHRGTADSVWRRLSATMSFRSDRRRSTCPLMDTWARRGRRRQGETGCTLPARFGCCWPLPPLEMFHPGVARGGLRRRYQRRQGSAGASMSSTASSRGTSAPSCSMCCSRCAVGDVAFEVFGERAGNRDLVRRRAVQQPMPALVTVVAAPRAGGAVDPAAAGACLEREIDADAKALVVGRVRAALAHVRAVRDPLAQAA